MPARAEPCPIDEFTRQMSILCAAFNRPVGDRVEAYFRAFARDGLEEVVRLFSLAVSEEADFNDVPTVPQLRNLRRRSRSKVTIQIPHGRQAALVEYVLRHRKVSDRQRSTPWNWITRTWPEPSKENQSREGFEFLGVIVPQDPVDPITYPASRTLFADVNWQQYLEQPPRIQ